MCLLLHLWVKMKAVRAIWACLEQLQTAQDSKYDHDHVNRDGEAAVTGCVAITHAASCFAFFYFRRLLLLVGPFFTSFHKTLTKLFCGAPSRFSFLVICCGAVKFETGVVALAIHRFLILFTLIRAVVCILICTVACVALEGIGCKIQGKHYFICATCERA